MSDDDILCFSCNLIPGLSSSLADITVTEGSDDGNMGELVDTRVTNSGPLTWPGGAFYENPALGDQGPDVVTTFNRLKLTEKAVPSTPPDNNGKRYPVYYDSYAQTIRAMDYQDFVDTFVNSMLTLVDIQCGNFDIFRELSPYKVLPVAREDVFPCYELVSSTPIFVDTVQNGYRQNFGFNVLCPAGTTRGLRPIDDPNIWRRDFLYKLTDFNVNSKAPLYITENDNLKEYGAQDVCDCLTPALAYEFCYNNPNRSFEYSLGPITPGSSYVAMGCKIVDENNEGAINYPEIIFRPQSNVTFQWNREKDGPAGSTRAYSNIEFTGNYQVMASQEYPNTGAADNGFNNVITGEWPDIFVSRVPFGSARSYGSYPDLDGSFGGNFVTGCGVQVSTNYLRLKIT